MTEHELVMLAQTDDTIRMRVTANDYSYEGYLVGLAKKRSGVHRAVIEDDNGRLFIHNAGQLTLVWQEVR